MAKTKKPAASAAPQSAAGKAAKNIRTREDLSKTLKGRIVLVANAAHNLAKQNDYKGIPSLESSDKPDAKYRSRMADRASGKKGAFILLNEDSQEFKNIQNLARAAKDDIAAKKYTSKVQDLLSAIVALSSGGGARSRDYSFVSDLDI